MDKHAPWKWLILLFLCATSMALVWPPFNVLDDDGRLVKPGKIKLGLDLRGGTSFVLEVDMKDLEDNAKTDAPERALEVIRNRIDARGTREPIIYLEPKQNRIILQIPELRAEEREEVVNLVESAAYLEFRLVHEDNDELVNRLFREGLAPDGYELVTLEEVGADGRPRSNYYYRRVQNMGATEEEVRAQREKLAKFQFRAGYEFMLSKVDRNGQELYLPYYVGIRPQLTGELLETAGVDYQQFGQPIVTLKFDARGAKRFSRVTADHAPGGDLNPDPNGRHYLAIVLDGTLYSAPFIRTAIYGGEAIIEGNFSPPEAQLLSNILRAGSLPAPVRVIEERTVDPTLGHDSIRSGSMALLYGAAAVMIFMVLYYFLAGVVANLSLVLDMILLPVGMMVVSGFLGLLVNPGAGAGKLSLPTLTLPGIAGIVLTIGMAVDANVLIFERIREEQRLGKRLKSAVTAGYEKAFSTIFDANLTTLITAVILFWQGSGPIRGFAVTLSAGIVVSMFVALVVTRMIFDLVADKTSLASIKMLELVREPRFDFLNKRFIAGGLSVAVILFSAYTFYQRGENNFGVDFTGGRAITFSFEERQDVATIRDALSSAGISESFIQYQQELVPDETGHTKEYLEIKVGFDEGDLAESTMLAQFGEEAGPDYKVMKEDSVGPQVGEELRKKGVWALVAALIGIVIYISFRFEFAFAMGAIIAVAHDVLVTVGIYCLLGRQLSLPIVAALLTIVGYSVNDTIVVFDRIREDLKLIKDKSYKDISNLSINQTLSRTLLTSITTLLTVVMLLIFGGGAINDFALALFIGIIVGTYSSIFVATPVMLLWHREKKADA